MKTTIFILLFAVSAQAVALQKQTIFLETITMGDVAHCFEPKEEAEADLLKEARTKCGGELKQISEFIYTLKKPVHSFCYPQILSAVFECLEEL